MNASDLHKDALVIDTHNDAIVAHIRRGNLSLTGDTSETARHSGAIDMLRVIPEGPAPGASYVQISVPLMTESGIDAAFFSIDVTNAFPNHLAYAMDGIGYFLADLDRTSSGVIVRRGQDILDARAAGKPAIILAIEHADCTERSLNVLRALYELGVRSIGLTHNLSSWAADGNGEARPGVGLTHYGVRLVQEMNRLGMLVDLAHVSESAFFSALEVTSKPVVFSHGNSRALCDHSRNLTDAQLKALAANGGTIGLSFVPIFVDQEQPSLERLLQHFDHIAEVAGVDVLAIGGDFDGGGTVLANAYEFPRLTEGLLKHGFSESDVRKILGENVLRVLRATIG